MTSTQPSEDAAPDTVTALTKGQRTRHKLLLAAQRVFKRDGFLGARVADIAADANVAHGTFYTYFDSKTDVFRALLTEFLPPIYQTSKTGSDDNPTPIERIERGNRRFYEVYRSQVKMFALLEQAATFDPEMKALRIRLRYIAERRARRSIQHMQEDGTVDPNLNAEIAASCLTAMATHSFYTWHIIEDRDYDVDEAVITLSRLWASALGLKPEPSDRPEYQTDSGSSKRKPAKTTAGKSAQGTVAAKKIAPKIAKSAAKKAGPAKKA